MPRDALEPVDEGEFYVCDVVGAEAHGPEGELGVVEDVLSYPACDVLLVRLAPSRRAFRDTAPGRFVERVDADEQRGGRCAPPRWSF